MPLGPRGAGTIQPVAAVLRVEVKPTESGARLALLGDDGALMAEWVQEDADWPRVSRSPDGQVATVVAGEVITAVRLADGHIVARCGTGRVLEVTLPLDERWTLEVTGELAVDGGHTGFQNGWAGFLRVLGQDQAEHEADVAQTRAELAAAARVATHHRFALRRGDESVVVHESTAAPVDGVEMLLWPPVIGPAGVLLRHAIEVDYGTRTETAPQRPWLVRPDRTVTHLPFELGVSPLIALPDGR